MKIVVGLSGGVDSAVSAHLLKEQGHEVEGAIMRIWHNGATAPKSHKGNACYGPDEEHDVDDAGRICDHLGIKLHVVDCADQYDRRVLAYFKKEYASGRTPNPCIVCNHEIKFGVLPGLLAESGIAFDMFATGHYARVGVDQSTGEYRLQTAQDGAKDQTYFLYRLSQQQLGTVRFPLGDLTKQDVRRIAKEAGLPVHDKEESQDFYSGDYAEILDKADGAGFFIDTAGKVLGRHDGIWNYTIGQRKGLGIAAGHPLYVVRIDAEKNLVVLGEAAELVASGLCATDISGFIHHKEGTGLVKIRSTSQPVPCSYEAQDGSLSIRFSEPQRAITPGQSAVVYNEGFVIGGGIIDKAIP